MAQYLARLFNIAALLLIFSCCARAQDNLALSAQTKNWRFSRATQLAVDGKFAPEGAAWNSASAIAAYTGDARLTIDLNKPTTIALILLQADGNDTYIVDFSLDEHNWIPVWRAAPSENSAGLSRRSVELDTPQLARYVRVRAGANDGSISISEVQLFDKRPTNWSEISATGPSLTPWQWSPILGTPTLERIKALTAALALIVLIANALLRAVARDDFLNCSRKSSMIGLAIVSAALWCNLFQFHFNSRIHLHEFYHYYLGAKFSPELGYTRLYRCTVVADSESADQRYSKQRNIRNLDDNTVISSSTVDSQHDCKQFFSPERWQSFSNDLKWFRESSTRSTYTQMQLDHGYNATPVWNALGYTLANATSASEHSLFYLSLIDPLLLLYCVVVGFIIFGLETTCVAVIFFGTNFIANYSWTGGAFLRLDWLVWSLIGLALLKSNRPLRASVCLTYAGLLRIFPFVFLAFVFVHAFANALRTRSLASLRATYGILLVALITATTLIALSAIPYKSLDAWEGFAANTRKHFLTRSTNMLGLEPLLIARSDNSARILQDPLTPDPFSEWKRLLDQKSSELRPTFIVIGLLFLLGVAHHLTRLKQWQAAALGISLLPFIHLSNYDYYFLVILALLGWRNQILLMTLAWLSWLAPDLCGDLDQTYIVTSALCVIAIALAPWLSTQVANRATPASPLA